MTILKYKFIRFLAVITALMSLAQTLNAGSLSAASDRADRWEFLFQTRYMEAMDIDFDGGAKASVNDDLGWNIGLTYNVDEHLAVGFDMGWADAGYAGTRVDDNGDTQQVSGNLLTSSLNFNGIYYFSAKRFTPYAGASLGWTFVDTNIPIGPPVTTCWYDPFWGYICDTYVPTKTTTELTYGAVMGLRFDLNDKLFLKAGMGKQWIEFSSAADTTDFTTYHINIGVMF